MSVLLIPTSLFLTNTVIWSVVGCFSYFFIYSWFPDDEENSDVESRMWDKMAAGQFTPQAKAYFMSHYRVCLTESLLKFIQKHKVLKVRFRRFKDGWNLICFTKDLKMVFKPKLYTFITCFICPFIILPFFSFKLLQLLFAPTINPFAFWDLCSVVILVGWFSVTSCARFIRGLLLWRSFHGDVKVNSRLANVLSKILLP